MRKVVVLLAFTLFYTGCASSGPYIVDTAHVPKGGDINAGLGVGGYWFDNCFMATDCGTEIVKGKTFKGTVDWEVGNGSASVGINAESGAESIERRRSEVWAIRLGGYPYVKVRVPFPYGVFAIKLFAGVGGDLRRGVDPMDNTHVASGMRLIWSKEDWTITSTLGMSDFLGLAVRWRFLYGGVVWRVIGAYGYAGVVLR